MSADQSHRLERAFGTRYRCVRLIGEGASSEVFEVLSTRGAVRALKVLRRMHPPDGEAAHRLCEEGRALATLDHPNVVRLLEIGTTEDGRPFLVMPRLEGETLRERLAHRGTLASRRACELLAGALDGLEAAHAGGIVHRDVKPANLFLVRRRDARRTARVVVLDFGVAALEGRGFAPTTGSHVLGTPRYLAPEQILGGRVDPRTDVYAMGLVLFESLSGRSPFVAEGPLEAMEAHLHAEPAGLRSVVPSISPEVAAVVGRAIARRPEDRWPSAGTFAAALRRLTARMPRPVTTPITAGALFARAEAP